MNDGVSVSEMGVNQGEVASRNILLYKSPRFKVFVPSTPKIPLKEGLHVQVSSRHDLTLPKEVLSRYVLVLGSAKALAESGLTQDAWANTRIEDGKIVSAYGRIPGVEKSWRTPVNTNQKVGHIITLNPGYSTERLQTLFGKYLPKWEELVKNISLFKNGVGGRDVEPIGDGDYKIWENNMFDVVVIRNPHLNGYHLVVSPKKSFQRQWQTVKEDEPQLYIQATLEATAIAIGIQQLIASGKGEIHNSGNWAVDLKTKKEGGKFDLVTF